MKKRLQRSYFPVNFAKLLKAPILQNTRQQLLLTSAKNVRNLQDTFGRSHASTAVDLLKFKWNRAVCWIHHWNSGDHKWCNRHKIVYANSYNAKESHSDQEILEKTIATLNRRMGVPKDFFLQQVRTLSEQILLVILQKGFKVFSKNFWHYCWQFFKYRFYFTDKVHFWKIHFPLCLTSLFLKKHTFVVPLRKTYLTDTFISWVRWLFWKFFTLFKLYANYFTYVLGLSIFLFYYPISTQSRISYRNQSFDSQCWNGLSAVTVEVSAS